VALAVAPSQTPRCGFPYFGFSRTDSNEDALTVDDTVIEATMIWGDTSARAASSAMLSRCSLLESQRRWNPGRLWSRCSGPVINASVHPLSDLLLAISVRLLIRDRPNSLLPSGSSREPVLLHTAYSEDRRSGPPSSGCSPGCRLSTHPVSPSAPASARPVQSAERRDRAAAPPPPESGVASHRRLESWLELTRRSMHYCLCGLLMPPFSTPSRAFKRPSTGDIPSTALARGTGAPAALQLLPAQRR